MPKPDPTKTLRIVVCESESCPSRDGVPQPHPVSADCHHPRTVVEPQPLDASAK